MCEICDQMREEMQFRSKNVKVTTVLKILDGTWKK